MIFPSHLLASQTNFVEYGYLNEIWLFKGMAKHRPGPVNSPPAVGGFGRNTSSINIFSLIHHQFKISICNGLFYLLFQKTYQFINVVNGVSHSHKTANIFFSFDSVAQPVKRNVYIGLRDAITRLFDILFWMVISFFRVKHPQISELHISHPKRVFLTPDRVFWAIVRENWFTGMGCSSVEEYK